MLPALCLDRNNTLDVLKRIQQNPDVSVLQKIDNVLKKLGPTPSLFVHNPVSERIAMLALAQGRRFSHHELKGYIQYQLELEPDVLVWEHTASCAIWEEGVRKVPKHFGFRLDGVFPTFHPNYRGKWPAHELVHSLCGLYWSPQQTRFSCYVGARLAELLPLTHWYGFDEVMRHRCDAHWGKPPAKEYCLECEARFSSYRDVVWDERLEEHSRRAWEFALGYYEEEKQACMKEMETGRVHAVPRVLLDSSSDAIGYMEGHWNRLCSWSFGAYMDLFVPISERHEELSTYAAHIDAVLKQISTNEVVIPTIEEHDSQFRLRLIQELGGRTVQVLEWTDEATREACWPVLLQGADAIHDGIDLDVEAWKEELWQILLHSSAPVETVLNVWDVCGLRRDTKWDASLQEGLVQSFETPIELQEEDVHSDHFWELGHLWKRIPLIKTEEELVLEGWLKNRPHEDQEARLFGMPFDIEQDGILRVNTTFRRGLFSKESMEKVLGWSEEAPIIACWHGGAPIVLVEDESLQELLSQVQTGTWRKQGGIDIIDELVSIGILIWIPQS